MPNGTCAAKCKNIFLHLGRSHPIFSDLCRTWLKAWSGIIVLATWPSQTTLPSANVFKIEFGARPHQDPWEVAARDACHLGCAATAKASKFVTCSTNSLPQAANAALSKLHWIVNMRNRTYRSLRSEHLIGDSWAFSGSGLYVWHSPCMNGRLCRLLHAANTCRFKGCACANWGMVWGVKLWSTVIGQEVPKLAFA